MSNEGNPLCPRKQAVMSTGGKLLCPTGCERVSRQPSMSYRFRTFSTKKCVPSESRQPLEIKGSGGFQNGLMFQPHPESTSFTSMGSLVRVQLSPPSASPCRSRACFFLLISVVVYPGVHDCWVYRVFTHKSTILYSSFCGGFGMAFLPAIGLPLAPA